MLFVSTEMIHLSTDYWSCVCSQGSRIRREEICDGNMGHCRQWKVKVCYINYAEVILCGPLCHCGVGIGVYDTQTVCAHHSTQLWNLLCFVVSSTEVLGYCLDINQPFMVQYFLYYTAKIWQTKCNQQMNHFPAISQKTSDIVIFPYKSTVWSLVPRTYKLTTTLRCCAECCVIVP
jgi:hypothetical protein